MLRSIAIWSRALPIIIILGALSLGQWAILFHGIATVKSAWKQDTHEQFCVVSETKAVFLALIYIYSMPFCVLSSNCLYADVILTQR